MKVILGIIISLLVLLGLATISVVVFLYKPDYSPFEETLGSNVIPVATMVAAWTTLLVAFAAFLAIRHSNEQRKRDRKERLLNEIIEWADNVGETAFLRQTKKEHELWSVLLKYRRLEAKHKYIDVFVKSEFHNLSQHVSDVNSKLKSVMDFTEECTQDDTKIKHLKEYEKILEDAIERFYEEAAKTRTRI